jgi:Kef-type K+ transport system membrane component KefB
VAVPLAQLLQLVLARATRWRLHFVALLVLGLCAVGERFGLAGPKTAFFLGLFSSRVRHEDRSLEEYLAPISRRFLIPLFFTALGTQVPLGAVFSWTAPLALGAAVLIIGYRYLLHARFAPTGGDKTTFLLFCPNFTLVALAAGAFFLQPDLAPLAPWLLLTGLTITMVATAALPVRTDTPVPA